MYKSKINNMTPVAVPTWGKMTSTDEKGNTEWWYVEIACWVNITVTEGYEEDPDVYDMITGGFLETEKGVGIALIHDGGSTENLFDHFTTKEPAYMDCVDAKDGSDVVKATRSDKFAPVSREALIDALKRSKGNKKIAAKLLGINRTAIFRIIKKQGLTDEYIKPYKTKN